MVCADTAKARGGSKDSILLTGATGALGTMLLRRLCQEGYDVICLVRGKDRNDARARIRAIVGDQDNVKVIRGDITEPRCGISDLDRELLVGRVKRIMHSAASINFMDKTETQLTNVAGLMHVLELTDVLDAWHVIHISTAYVVGDAPYLTEQSLSLGQRWSNTYEETKFVGERLLRAWGLKRDDRRFTVYRPSVLIGCEDGTTSTIDGYYRYLEPLHRVAQSLRNHDSKSPSPDIQVSADGWVTVPLAVHMPATRLNYVPIDWAADMMVAAIDLPPRNETLHFVHPDPVPARDCLSWSLELLKIRGVSVHDTAEEKELAVKSQSPLVRRLQRRIDVVHDAFVPYVTREPGFQMELAPRQLGARYRPPVAIDRPYIERALGYVQANFWDAAGEPDRVSA